MSLVMMAIGPIELIAVLVVGILVATGTAAVIFVILQLLQRRKTRNAAPFRAESTVKLPTCPRCGIPLSADAPQGLCPRCVLQVGIGTEDASEPAFRDSTGKPNPPDPAELARHFPQLEIIELLGQGGMGAVYKARQKDLDRVVALKVLPGGPGGDPAFAERFTREARALARLSHPNIVAVHEFGQVQRSAAVPAASANAGEGAGAPVAGGAPALLYYFVMEFIDGPNLRQLMHGQKLSPSVAMSIVPKICEALQFAHDEGIVHRDVKPENILLDKKGRVKIADFGIAKIVGKTRDATITGARDVIGTPHYMAPEQVEHPTEVDHRADIYSLGVVFYEMLTGELPLGKFEAPSHRVQVDVRLDDVVLRSLAKAPERRYQHASEVKTDVETIAAGAPKAEVRLKNAEVNRDEQADGPRGFTSAATTADSRFSRLAILGACWAPLFFIAAFLSLFQHAVTVPQGGPPPGPAWWQIGLSFTLLPLGLTAPFGTTICGAVALSQIRRSGGRLCGLGLALFDTLLFPLLILNWIIGWLVYLLMCQSLAWVGFKPGTEVALETALLPAALIIVVINVWLVRWAWRSAKRTSGRVPTAAERAAAAAWVRVAKPVSVILLLGAAFLMVASPLHSKRRADALKTKQQAATNAVSVSDTDPVPSLTMSNVPLRDAIRNCAKQIQLNVLFDPQLEFDRSGPNGRSVLQSQVNVKWENVTMRTALKTLLDSHGLTLKTDPESGIARISKKSFEPVSTSLPEPPPVVIRTEPESGATGVDPALTGLRVTFSKPMQDGNWSWVKLDDETFPETTGDPRYLEDGRTCVLPVKLQPGRTYATWINVDNFQLFQGMDGQSSVPYLLVFETKVDGSSEMRGAVTDAPDLVTVGQNGGARFTSVQDAIDAVAEGGTVQIGPGRYEERLSITKPVRLIGAGWEKTVIGPANAWEAPSPEQMQEMEGKFRAATSDAERSRLRQEFARELRPPVVFIQETSDVVLEGLKLTAPGVASEGNLLPGAVIEVRSAALVLRDSAVVGSPGSGIVLTDGARADIRNSLIAAAWNRGVAIDGDSRVVIRDCDIRNCHYAGVTIKGGAEAAIERCRISGAAWHGIRYDHASPRIEGNLIFGNARSGIYASGKTAAQVRRNVFFNNEMNGISCWSDNKDAIEGNTFDENQREALAVLGASAPTVRSNIFSGHPVALIQWPTSNEGESPAPSRPQLMHNIFWNNATNWVRDIAGPEEGAYRRALVELPDATQSRIEDPRFANAEQKDFRLTSDSPARRAGIGVADPIPFTSPWPLQREEQAIIPDGETRDSRQWKHPGQ